MVRTWGMRITKKEKDNRPQKLMKYSILKDLITNCKITQFQSLQFVQKVDIKRIFRFVCFYASARFQIGIVIQEFVTHIIFPMLYVVIYIVISQSCTSFALLRNLVFIVIFRQRLNTSSRCRIYDSRLIKITRHRTDRA